jgi:hypothetical protein
MPARRKIPIYLEIGARRIFAGAVDWPGWCRSGRDEASALASLLVAGPRYARALRSARLGFVAPDDGKQLVVARRLKGDSTTDFGAPGQELPEDQGSLSASDIRRLQAILQACWRAFDAAAKSATGKRLEKGPRGGGRELQAIRRHVLEAEGAYLSQLGRKAPVGTGSIEAEQKRMRALIMATLADVGPQGRPPPGPRGGERWTPRYFVRRVAWHALDHAWEIEDRAH